MLLFQILRILKYPPMLRTVLVQYQVREFCDKGKYLCLMGSLSGLINAATVEFAGYTVSDQLFSKCYLKSGFVLLILIGFRSRRTRC
jgi:hypothetical protein